MTRALMVLAITTVVVAQQQPPPPRTGALAPGGTGLVAGRVIDPVSGQPVSGAVVWFQIDVVMRPESPRVLTDADGRFVFVNVPAGRYNLQAQKLGYLRGFYGQKHIMDQGTELDIADGQLLTDVTIPIWKQVAIGGTVTDEAGEPVVGVPVRVFRKLVAFGEIRFTPNFQGTTGMTDDRGVYRLSSLAPGEFIVAVPSTMTTFPVDIMRDLFQPEVQSVASAAISELSPLGFPANQQVGELVIMAGNRAIIPPAPAEGVAAVYRTALFPEATKLGEATTIALGPGEERSGVDIMLRPVRAGRVSGVILGPDGAPGPTAVRLMPAGDAFLSATRGFEIATGVSDAAGRFTLLGVPEGQYTLWIEKRRPSASNQTSLLHGTELVTVGPTGAAEVQVTLRMAPRVTVRLDIRGGAKIRPESVEVLLEAAGFGGAATIVPDRTTPVTIQMVPGRYIVTPYTDVACTSVLFQGRDVSDEPLVLTNEDVELTVICGEPPTRLTGTVRSERGAPDSDALVVVFPADRRFWGGAGLRARRKASAQANAAGAFSLTNLPPGDYFVAALPIAGSDFWQEPKVLEALSASATRVSFGPGESRTVDVRTVRLR